jgi:outer membrane protein TolC
MGPATGQQGFKKLYPERAIGQALAIQEGEKDSVLLVKTVKSCYYQWAYHLQQANCLHEQSTLYQEWNRKTNVQYKLGEIDWLEKNKVHVQAAKKHNAYLEAKNAYWACLQRLKSYMGSQEDFVLPHDSLPLLPFSEIKYMHVIFPEIEPARQEDQFISRKQAHEHLLLQTRNQWQQLTRYRETLLPSARAIKTTAEKQYQAETINFREYLESMAMYTSAHLQYIEMINRVNQSIIELDAHVAKKK